MPVFITDMVARGFWWALLALTIVNLPLAILGMLLQKKIKVLGTIIQYLPVTLFTFYIWNVREGAFWLIFGIIWAIGFIAVLFQASKNKS